MSQSSNPYSKSCNYERAEWRRKARTALATHIEERLGVKIPAGEVLLIPKEEAPYKWTMMPERQHIFEKNLSKHNISTFKEICREVGRSFEAVARDAAETGDVGLAPSFTAAIAQLQHQNQTLSLLLDQTRHELAACEKCLEETRHECETLKTHLKWTQSTLQHRNKQQQLYSRSLVNYEKRDTAKVLGIQKFQIGLKALQDDLTLVLQYGKND